MKRLILVSILLGLALFATAQNQKEGSPSQPLKPVYVSSSCAGCHGEKGQGGLGPKLAGTKLESATFLKVVREGEGAMPGVSQEALSDEAVLSLLEELKGGSLAPAPVSKATDDLYSTSSCMGCHGQTAMGGLGPPLAQLKLEEAEFLGIVRRGKGMMPGTGQDDLSDQQAKTIRSELQTKPYLPDQIPVAFKVSQFLTTKNVTKIFGVVALIALILGVWQFVPWIRCSGIGSLKPVKTLGFGRFAAVSIKSLVFDALLVQSLWKADKFRWFMHGLMLYGFIGLFAADILISIFNPLRTDLALTDPLKLFPMVCGGMLLTGLIYVMVRYKTDRYIDNGLTLSGDFLFLNLMIHTVVSGFLAFTLNRLGVSLWVMPLYIYHLCVIAALLVTAPFSRFQHAWVVPYLMVVSRLTDAVVDSGVDIGFSREPSPGRHHKSTEIAQSVLANLGDDYAEAGSRFRYYP